MPPESEAATNCRQFWSDIAVPTLLRQCTMYTSSSGNRQNLVAQLSMCCATSTLSKARHTCSAPFSP